MPAASSKPPKIGNNPGVEAGLQGFVLPVVKGVGKGLWLLARRPRALACFALASTATFLLSTGLVLALLLIVLGAYVAGCVWLPAAFRHPARGKAKKASYARGWMTAMKLCGLMKRDGTQELVPKLVAVRCSPYFDHLTLHLRPGQTRKNVLDAADAIAHTFHSPACRVMPLEHKWHHGRGTRVSVNLQRQDALAAVVARIEAPEDVNLEAVAIGRTEYGDVWSINLLGTHYLVGGATGAGKGSVLWSIINGIGPAIRDGRVQLWGIDPKGGQELIHGKEMFTRYVGEDDDLDEAEQLLTDLVTLMKGRSSEFAQTRARKPTVTVEQPLILCVVDEMADLTLCPDSRQAGRFKGLMSQLCRRGRSVGITMLMLLQDPRKEAVPFRDQIPHGIGLRLSARFEVDAICGPGAYEAGANCLEIPGAPEPGQPLDGRGTAFMTTLGKVLPVRVRASYITDDDLAEMCTLYPAYDHSRVSDAIAVAQEFDVDDDEREPSKP
jgi:S-DNA-T family DNA segregation ATPase FtsK/SpoIIIE